MPHHESFIEVCKALLDELSQLPAGPERQTFAAGLNKLVTQVRQMPLTYEQVFGQLKALVQASPTLEASPVGDLLDATRFDRTRPPVQPTNPPLGAPERGNELLTHLLPVQQAAVQAPANPTSGTRG